MRVHQKKKQSSFVENYGDCQAQKLMYGNWHMETDKYPDSKKQVPPPSLDLGTFRLRSERSADWAMEAGTSLMLSSGAIIV